MNMHPRRNTFTPDMGEQRELPSTIVDEQALLGAILVNNEVIDFLPENFNERHFEEPLHADLFREMKRLYAAGKGINPVSLKMAVDRQQMVKDMTVAQYIAKLSIEAVGVALAPDSARAVMEGSWRREGMGIAQRIMEACHRRELVFADEIQALTGNLAALSHEFEERTTRTLADAADNAVDLTADAMVGKGIVGIDHGFQPLMSLMGPMIPGHLIVVGGGTKQGKSSLIEQIIAGAAVNGSHIWVYSGEMSAEELAGRALSRLTDIQAWRQVQGKVSEPDLDKLHSAKRYARKWMERISIEDKSMTLAQIDREIVRFSKRHPSALAVVDHIGLIERDKNTFRMSEAEFGPVATQALKMTARRAQVPLIAAAQLKKNTFVQEGRLTKDMLFQAVSRRPKYTDLIGAVEKDANHVIIPFRAEPILQELEPIEGSDLYAAWQARMEEIKGNAEIRLALSRHRSWPQKRDVKWNGAKTQFEEKIDNDQGRMNV